jgi:predicted GIY-YIG superfamily endonuclease
MSPASKPWFVYLVRCRDGSIYTGITDDVDARLNKHNLGRGAAYTAQRRPVSLIYQELHPDQGSALRREARIKRWKKQKKEDLARGRRVAAIFDRCLPEADL